MQAIQEIEKIELIPYQIEMLESYGILKST